MILDNGILRLELVNKGGEMASLIYKGHEVLYKGDGPYWTGKNPTLFPMISSPKTKQYTLDGKTYPCRNHGLIRYMDLKTIKDDGQVVTMRLSSNEETLKEYPFEFEYNITYKLDNNRVLINYDITNNSNKTMPFTFGLHPGFNVKSFNEANLKFIDAKGANLFNQNNKSCKWVDLSEYSGSRFLKEVQELETVIFTDLNANYVDLNTQEYKVRVDMSKYKYLALWTANKDANYICIEPWLSINDIKNSNNPFDSKFELEYLKPNETFNIDYSIEVRDPE